MQTVNSQIFRVYHTFHTTDEDRYWVKHTISVHHYDSFAENNIMQLTEDIFHDVHSDENIHHHFSHRTQPHATITVERHKQMLHFEGDYCQHEIENVIQFSDSSGQCRFEKSLQLL